MPESESKWHPSEMDDPLEIGLKMLRGADADQIRKNAPPTALELLLFFLFFAFPLLFILLFIEGSGGLEFRKDEVNPTSADEPATTLPTTTVAPTTTTTQIEVVQPPTEVIEGPPVPAPEPESPAPPPQHEAPAPETAAPAPAPPHGG